MSSPVRFLSLPITFLDATKNKQDWVDARVICAVIPPDIGLPSRGTCSLPAYVFLFPDLPPHHRRYQLRLASSIRRVKSSSRILSASYGTSSRPPYVDDALISPSLRVLADRRCRSLIASSRSGFLASPTVESTGTRWRSSTATLFGPSSLGSTRASISQKLTRTTRSPHWKPSSEAAPARLHRPHRELGASRPSLEDFSMMFVPWCIVVRCALSATCDQAGGA